MLKRQRTTATIDSLQHVAVLVSARTNPDEF